MTDDLSVGTLACGVIIVGHLTVPRSGRVRIMLRERRPSATTPSSPVEVLAICETRGMARWARVCIGLSRSFEGRVIHNGRCVAMKAAIGIVVIDVRAR